MKGDEEENAARILQGFVKIIKAKLLVRGRRKMKQYFLVKSKAEHLIATMNLATNRSRFFGFFKKWKQSTLSAKKNQVLQILKFKKMRDVVMMMKEIQKNRLREALRLWIDYKNRDRVQEVRSSITVRVQTDFSLYFLKRRIKPIEPTKQPHNKK